MSPRRAIVIGAGRVVVLAAALAIVVGCGRRETTSSGGETLSLAELDQRRDTTGLSRGTAIVREFMPYRMTNRALRVRGELALPEGTVLQIAVFRRGERYPFARVQSDVRGGRFDTPPILGEHGTLPEDDYRFELIVFFDASVQPPSVMRATAAATRLRGPGITRDVTGKAAFAHSEERRL